MLMIKNYHIRYKSLDVELLKNFIFKFMDRKFKYEYYTSVYHMVDQMNQHMNYILNNRFLVKVEAILLVINHIIVDIDHRYLKQYDEQVITDFQKNYYPYIYKLLKDLITLNLKYDINCNVQLDDNMMNFMSLESDTCMTDKEFYNKKKGITKKTVYAAKIREMAVNLLTNMAKNNLSALHPYYFGLFENQHFENYPDIIFILLYDTFRKCQISTSNLICTMIDNFPIKNNLYIYKYTDVIQLSKRKMKEIGLVKPLISSERDSLSLILDILMQSAFVCLDREVNKYSYPYFLKYIIKYIETIYHGRSNLPLLIALLNTSVNKFNTYFSDPKKKKENELYNLYSYFLKLISTLIYTIYFIDDSRIKFYSYVQRHVDNWSKFIKLIFDKTISSEFQIEVINFTAKIVRIDIDILNEDKSYLKDVIKTLKDKENDLSNEWYRYMYASVKLVESLYVIEYPDTDKKFQSFIPYLRIKKLDKVTNFIELVTVVFSDYFVEQTSSFYYNVSDTRGLEITLNIIGALIIIDEDNWQKLVSIQDKIMDKLLEICKIKLDNRDGNDAYNNNFINLKGSAYKALGNIISFKMHENNYALAQTLYDSIKFDFVRGYANRVLFSRKLSFTLCSSIGVLSKLTSLESIDFQSKFEISTNLLKYSVYFSNSDKEKVSACGYYCIGILGVNADPKLFSKINYCNMPAYELVITYMLKGISDRHLKISSNCCIAICHILENKVYKNFDDILWMKSKENLVSNLLKCASSLNKDFKLKSQIILVICKLRECNELIKHDECLSVFYTLYKNVKRNYDKNQIYGELRKKELLKELILASIVQILVDVKQPKLIRNFVSTLGSNLILLIEAIYQSSSYVDNDNAIINVSEDINIYDTFKDKESDEKEESSKSKRLFDLGTNNTNYDEHENKFNNSFEYPDFSPNPFNLNLQDNNTKFARSTLSYSNNFSSNMNMNPTSILISDYDQLDSGYIQCHNNMPRFLISDELDLNSSTSNLFFDPLGKKREVSNSLEKLIKEDKQRDNTNEQDKDKHRMLSYNISKKGMLPGSTEVDEVDEIAEDTPYLIMNSPSEKYIYDHPKRQIKSTLNMWVNNRYCTNQMVSKLINFIEMDDESIVSFSVINELKELKHKYEHKI